MTARDFEDWKALAAGRDILEEAIARGAVLKRVGKEHAGPCPACGGKDRFAINVQKRIFNCRGSTGGDVIGMVMHIDGVSFMQACEALSGEPPPNGQSKPLSEDQKRERAKALAEAKARERAAEAEQAAYQEDTREAALAIWQQGVPLPGSIAETYLRSRGLGLETWPDVLRFHSSLPYPKRGMHPTLLCRVDDVSGDFTAIWRIYLRADGRKLDVEHPKLGLGPAGGGAVRLGGFASKIAVAEGVESALGYWLMIGRGKPVWAALSTAGLIGFECPLGVEHVVVAPDGDRPVKRQGDEYVPAEPAGRKAAESLRARLREQGIGCAVAAYPPVGRDFNDLWLQMQQENA